MSAQCVDIQLLLEHIFVAFLFVFCTILAIKPEKSVDGLVLQFSRDFVPSIKFAAENGGHKNALIRRFRRRNKFSGSDKNRRHYRVENIKTCYLRDKL